MFTPPKDTNNLVTAKSKDILVKRGKSLPIPELKILDTDSNTDKLESEFTGSMIPFIIFNQHTFNYKQIENFTLTYNGALPEFRFTIFDHSGEFKTLYIPLDDDIVSLYLKPHNEKYKPIYIQFTPLTVSEDEGYLTFTCTPKISALYTEVCKSYKDLTSYDVFDKMSVELKLGFATNIDATNDKMTWINPFESNLNFMRDCINHSYKDDKSFFEFFVDFYYNLNFIELNNQFGINQPQETIISMISPQKQDAVAAGEEVEIAAAELILSNVDDFRGTSNFIQDYSIVNSAGEIKIQNGYERYAQFFDTQLNEFQSHLVQPNYETTDPKFVRLTKNGEIQKYKYLGIQQISDSYKNVHDNYHYAMIQNYQNNEETNKVMMSVKIDKANFHIYRYQSIPIAIYEYSSINKDKLGVKNDMEIGGEQQKPRAVILEQYTGHFVVKNITYKYSNEDSYIRQELLLSRREWPTNKTKV
jgi:hypothetical protein